MTRRVRAHIGAFTHAHTTAALTRMHLLLEKQQARLGAEGGGFVFEVLERVGELALEGRFRSGCLLNRICGSD